MTSRLKAQMTIKPRFRFNLKAQDALNLLATFYNIAVNSRHCEMKMDKNTEDNLISIAKYITQEVPKIGLMLCGTCGNGKTTMVYALKKTIDYLERFNHFSFMGEYFEGMLSFVDVSYILQIVRDEEKYNSLRQRSLLAIDDMGKEPVEVMIYGTVSNPVIDLMEYRYQHQLFTVVTTNLTPQEIKEKYGKRVADRFREMMEVIVFQDISYRG